MPSPGRLRVSTAPVRRTAPRALFATLAAVLGLAAILLVQYRVQRLGGAGPGRFRLLWLVLGWQVIALAVATALRWAPRRVAAALVLASLVALPAMSLTRPSQISDDQYRYAWDGRIQAAGIDPYRYAPNDPALSSFRDGWLWPDAATCHSLHKAIDPADPTHACTRINRPSVRTIYPPVAEGYFLAAHWIPGPPADHRLQLDAAVLSAALASMLAFGLRRTGRPSRLVAYYSFAPIAGLDIAGDAHVDVLGALFGTAAIVVAATSPRWRARAGALAGLAIAVKLYPALLLPSLMRRYRRGNAYLLGAAVGVLAVGYVPHVIAVGPHVLGYLRGYLSEDGYSTGSRFVLLGLLGLPQSATKVLAALLLLAALAVVAIRCAHEQMSPQAGALTALAAAFLIATPAEPWYGVLLVAAAVLCDRPEWFAVAAAAYPLYVAGVIHHQPLVIGRISYGVGGAVALAVTLLRAWQKSRHHHEIPSEPNQKDLRHESLTVTSRSRSDGIAAAGINR